MTDETDPMRLITRSLFATTDEDDGDQDNPPEPSNVSPDEGKPPPDPEPDDRVLRDFVNDMFGNPPSTAV